LACGFVGSVFTAFSVMDSSNNLRRAVVHVLDLCRRHGVRVAIFFFLSAAHAQVNSWTNLTSGNWEDPYWSLGALPATNQTILITNSGWKAVAVGSGTAQYFPESLAVNSITISSPADSFNTLLLNYVGFQTPLEVSSLSIGSNSAITLLASSLRINGPNGIGLSIGGTFTQAAGSLVSGGQMDVGYIGPGLYHMSDGLLTVTQVFLGGGSSNVFVQDGGTNSAGIVHLERGVYLLNNGVYDTTTYFTGGTLVQRGGIVRSGTGGGAADYLLHGGTNLAGLSGGTAMQTGGLLRGYVSIHDGSYTLSNGIVDVNGMTLDGRAYFVQYGGKVTVNGAISTSGESSGRGTSWDWWHGGYGLAGGTLSCAKISMPDGSYLQTGGTNIVAGSIIVAPHGAGPAPCPVHVSGGTLMAPEIITGPAGLYGGLIQSGGQIIVSNLTIGSPSPQNLPGQFLQTGGTIRQSGVFTLNNSSRLTVAPGDQEFGQLRSFGGSLTFASNAPTIIHFAAISSNMSLAINNWSGSFAGGGTHQIFFGNSSGAITPAALVGVSFHNPAGVPPDVYPARLLSTGELVPVTAPWWTAAWPGGRMWLSPQSNASLQLNFQGTAGRNYLIQSSSNLIDWEPLTNSDWPDGVLSVFNVWTTNGSSRFYRARLIQ
jgi:hypothetical protein